MERLKAILTSNGLTKESAQYLPRLLGQSPQGVEVLFVPTLTNKPWLTEQPSQTEQILRDLGFRLEIRTINSLSRRELPKLHPAIVYLSGGNIYALAQLTRDLRFAGFLKKVIEGGGIYTASSATSILASTDFSGVELHPDNDRNLNKIECRSGFDLIFPWMVWPHYKNYDNRHVLRLQKAKELFSHKVFIPLADGQAVVFEGKKHQVVGTPEEDANSSEVVKRWF